VACALSLILLVDRAVQEAKRRGARSYARCAGEVVHDFLSSRRRPTYTHCEFFAVWRATVAKFSFLTTGPPHARPLQSDGLMLDWIAVPDFLGGLLISVAAFPMHSKMQVSAIGLCCRKKFHGAGAICAHARWRKCRRARPWSKTAPAASRAAQCPYRRTE
jgi:hypothetical protein